MDTAIERRRKVLRRIADREQRDITAALDRSRGFFIDAAVLTIEQWLMQDHVPEFFGMVMLCEATRPGHWLLHGRWAHEPDADPHGLITHASDERLRGLLILRGYHLESRLPNGAIEFWERREGGSHAH